MHEMSSAELNYLFRHQVLREGMYQLMLPSERSRLHLHAMASYGPVDDNLQTVRELVLHAQCALADGHGLGHAEEQAVNATLLRHLQRWADLAGRAYQGTEEADAWRAVACHPGSSNEEAARAHLRAALAFSNGGRNHDAISELDACRERLAGQLAGALAVEELTRRAAVLSMLGDPPAGEKCSREAVAIAEVLGSEKHMAAALNSLGHALERLGHLKESLVARERACALTASESLRADMLFGYSSILRELGRKDEALKAAREAYEISLALHDVRLFVSTLVGLAINLRAHGQLKEAEDLYLRGIDFCRERGLRRGYISCLGNLANLISSRELDFSRAESMLVEVIGMQREDGATTAEAISTNNLASTLLSAGKFTAAVRVYERAQELSVQVSYPLLEARTACFKGQCLSLLGRHEEAMVAATHGLQCLEGRDEGKFMLEFGELTMLYVKLARPDCTDQLSATQAAASRMRELADAIGADTYASKALDITMRTEAHLREDEAPLLERFHSSCSGYPQWWK